MRHSYVLEHCKIKDWFLNYRVTSKSSRAHEIRRMEKIGTLSGFLNATHHAQWNEVACWITGLPELTSKVLDNGEYAPWYVNLRHSYVLDTCQMKDWFRNYKVTSKSGRTHVMRRMEKIETLFGFLNATYHAQWNKDACWITGLPELTSKASVQWWICSLVGKPATFICIWKL
jgi:hypothetical protein